MITNVKPVMKQKMKKLEKLKEGMVRNAMRNKYAGTCYYCSRTVEPGKGHFERHRGSWLTIHANCVFEQRKEKEQLLQGMVKK
jgi:hypothetical protein